jgi:MraZ protein
VVESGVKGSESMFTGKYIHNVDEKNRIIIPAKFRESLASGAYITLGLDQCLTIYPLDEWNKFIDKTLQLNTNSADVRKYIRTISSNAVECSFDKQGRVSLPVELMSIAKITGECVLIGNLETIEIWAKDRWDEYSSNPSATFEDLAEKLANI